MILSGIAIKDNLNQNIIIEPFNNHQLNPNSYNIRLDDTLLMYNCEILDMKVDNPYKKVIIPKEGIVLEPGKIYLGKTVEYTETYNLVPSIEGRSSIGRLGISVHVSAPYGNDGFKGCWTLEITCIQPVRIYAGVQIGQLYYHVLQGESTTYSSEKYQGNRKVQTSKLYEEFI